MTDQELKSVLLPGATLESFIVDPEKARIMLEETEKRQDKILKQKIIRQEDLDQLITI